VKNAFPTILTLTALALTTLTLTGCPSTPSVPNTSVSPGNNTGNNTGSNTGTNTGETTPAPDTTKPSIGTLEINAGKLSVTASDASGIKKVEFYREALKELAAKQAEAVAASPFFTDSSAPYEYEFDASENGQYNFYVKVFDQKDNVETSGKTAATIQQADTKAPSKPAMTLNKTVLSSGEALTANVTTNDNVGVTRVDLILVGTPETVLESDTTAPYLFERTLGCQRLKASASPVEQPVEQPVAPVVNSQSKVFKVVAYDAAGNSSASDPQTVTVDCGISKE
jgi:large repetitive protein